MTDQPLVSVVIPACNVECTLDETLRSVRSQSYRTLEILIINDGSTDDTLLIAERHAAADSRVVVITQRNAGLAAARNTGWRHARANLIAFVDADDLWAPSKIARQVQAMIVGGERLGLVYAWYARIDADSVTTALWDGVRFEGRVLDSILAANFIGNGSSALVRRQALVDADGFDAGLRSAGAEGCEDWLFYCRVAEKYEFAVLAEHLVGYRAHANNMSSNRPRMLRSWMLAHDQLLRRQPQHRIPLAKGVRNYASWLMQDALSAKALQQIPALMRLLFAEHRRIAAQVLVVDAPLAVLGKVARRVRRLTSRSVHRAGAVHGTRYVIGVVDA
jgi:glycosyltransferase involved in cell wall biosynthesis